MEMTREQLKREIEKVGDAGSVEYILAKDKILAHDQAQRDTIQRLKDKWKERRANLIEHYEAQLQQQAAVEQERDELNKAALAGIHHRQKYVETIEALQQRLATVEAALRECMRELKQHDGYCIRVRGNGQETCGSDYSNDGIHFCPPEANCGHCMGRQALEPAPGQEWG